MKPVTVQEVLDAMYDASVIARIRTHGIAPPDGVDWRELYRIQTAMRYMDNSSLPEATAFKMADEDIKAMLAAAPKQENDGGYGLVV